MKKLTMEQKNKVKKFIKNLKETSPGTSEINELDKYQEELLDKLNDTKDSFISLLVEMDDTIGTSDVLYKRYEKLIDHFTIIEKVLPEIFKQYKQKLSL